MQGPVISRAIASDMYSGNELTKFLSLLMLVNGIAPVIAPALGGLILSFATWRMVFIVLTIFGLMMLFGILFKVPESLSNDRRVDSHLSTLFQSFKFLFMTPRFVLPMMFASIGITLTISSQLTGKLVDYVERHLLLRVMTMVQILGVVIVTVTLINHFNFWILAIGFVILVAPVTGVATLGFSIAMDESKSGKGSSSSLLGLFQTLLGGLMFPLVGIKGETNPMPYIIIITFTAMIFVILQIINKKVFKKAKPHS
ncbi:MFS transporter [Staphylococcus saccharolyticus]|uniref:MFS transporter n=1 Tax=Staphylococcus saccharolyticus TaxID=33028 RepID=UPI003D7FA536